MCVTTTKSRAAAAARIGAGLGRQNRAELLGLLRGCFTRVEPWLQAGRYVAAVASGMAKRNGWTIAEQAGDRGPERTQRLLNRAAWDTFAAMGAPYGWSRPRPLPVSSAPVSGWAAATTDPAGQEGQNGRERAPPVERDPQVPAKVCLPDAESMTSLRGRAPTPHPPKHLAGSPS